MCHMCPNLSSAQCRQESGYLHKEYSFGFIFSSTMGLKLIFRLRLQMIPTGIEALKCLESDVWNTSDWKGIRAKGMVGFLYTVHLIYLSDRFRVKQAYFGVENDMLLEVHMCVKISNINSNHLVTFASGIDYVFLHLQITILRRRGHFMWFNRVGLKDFWYMWFTQHYMSNIRQSRIHLYMN